MTGSSDTPQVSGRRAPSIRRALLLRFVGLIALAFTVFCAGLYFLIVRPATHEIAAVFVDVPDDVKEQISAHSPMQHPRTP